MKIIVSKMMQQFKESLQGARSNGVTKITLKPNSNNM
ncbi:hypothetical protein TPHSE_25630 [Terrisporobacter petrolearius]